MSLENCVKALNKVDDLNFRLACGVNLLVSLHEAMEYGTLGAEAYKDGLFGAFEYIDCIREEIQAAVDGCFKCPAASCGGHSDG